MKTKADLLHGMQANADYLGVKRSQAYQIAQNAHLPAFKMNGRLCIRRTTLDEWIAEREAAAVQERAGSRAA